MKGTVPTRTCTLYILGLLSIDVLAIPTQQPLLILPPPTTSAHSVEELRWTEPPSPDDTGNLIFNSLNGFLKHQPNVLYRNGHAIVAGTVTPGTLLYHSSLRNCTGLPPSKPEWVSFDPEHSYMFGSRMYTFQVVKPLKVLYFDGSSAAKMPSGPMDTQEILTHGGLTDGGWRAETDRTRIVELCEWGKDFGLDGFLRMEFDFEMMLCDFSVGMEVVSALDLFPVRGVAGRLPDCPSESMNSLNTKFRHERQGFSTNESSESFNPSVDLYLPSDPPRRGPRGPPPTPPPGWVGSLRPEQTVLIEAIQAGNWHDLPGLTQSVQLDYTRFVTFFDPKYKSLIRARRAQKEKGAFRAGNATKIDADVMLADLREMLRTWNVTRSEGMEPRITWSLLVQTVVERYSTRLEYLLLLLSTSNDGPGAFNATQISTKARWQVLIMLSPYMPVTSIPSVGAGSNYIGSVWLDPTIRHCSNVYTSRIPSSTLTSSECLIRGSVEAVAGEICRTLGIIWLEAFDVESKREEEQVVLVMKWYSETRRLMDWLGWAGWTKFITCDPACSVHEFCTFPQWPMDTRNEDESGKLNKPYCHSRGLE